MLGLGFDGRVFEDNFLIADVKMKADFPTERWFWFEPHFKSGDSRAAAQAARRHLAHRLPAGLEHRPQDASWSPNVSAPGSMRCWAPDVDYELEWTSIYTFQCRRMDRFRHGRVIFAGDSAHQVSPFGARGANSGIQDIDNLGWKLKLVIDGTAPESAARQL